MGTLKDYREKELKHYVVGNIVIVLFLSGLITDVLQSGTTSTIEFLNKILYSTLVSTVLYVYVFLLDSMIPWNWKEKIAYLPLGQLPGYTIFSDMKKRVKDNRFTQGRVLQKYAGIYENLPLSKKERMAYENENWYEIYKKYQASNKVYTANRDYLLCRDITMMTLIMLLIYLVVSVPFGIVSFSWKMVLWFTIECIVADIAMRGKAKRFAYNVIAEDIFTN